MNGYGFDGSAMLPATPARRGPAAPYAPASPHLALRAGERLRAGTQVLRTLYVHSGDHKGRLVGVADTPELAELIVTAVNGWLDGQQNATDGATDGNEAQQ